MNISTMVEKPGDRDYRSGMSHPPDPADFLEHVSDDCVGMWARQAHRDGPWTCTRCGREHPSTPENDARVYREFARGAQLRSQTRQGRFPTLPVQPGPVIELPHPDAED